MIVAETRYNVLPIAIDCARREKAIIILWENSTHWWEIANYPYNYVEFEGSVRYVLPNGEVCKLS